ncbi:MAG: DUF5107 domain-containing protein [Candidatus Sumerlaeia bacterium]|nr:DUF5107 domain-containing protein [Candidatus Sumerlaeia bacterium]
MRLAISFLSELRGNRTAPFVFVLALAYTLYFAETRAFSQPAAKEDQRAELAAQGLFPVQTRAGTITIPTYPWGPDDVNPHFPQIIGKPIYPYPMQDNLSRKKEDRTYETLVVENAYLRVTVIPELGGHVHSVFDKTTGKEMFYVNPVIKPGLIGLRGAWISGGIEFNTGPHGHTVTAVSPVSCRFVEFDDGSKGIAIGNIERVFRTQWVVVVRLRPDRCFLEERVRIYNPTPYVQPYYFWNCTAVPNTDGMQFIYPMTLGTDHAGTSFFRWPVDKGVDLSWSKNYKQPTSIFAYQCDQDFFGSYDHDEDRGIVAYANHFELPGKKAWTWGRGSEGLAAQATLTDDGSLYNEVQTGPLVTQADYGLLQPHQTIEWTEWWYPVHGIGGYEFATKDVAVNVVEEKREEKVRGKSAPPADRVIKIIGTAMWENAECRVRVGEEVLASERVAISPMKPTVWRPTLKPETGGTRALPTTFTVEIAAGDNILASFVHPLPLPKREPPDVAKKGRKADADVAKSAQEHWADGVLADKQSKVAEARKHFQMALEKDANFAPAHLSLAILDLEAGLPQQARPHLERVIKQDPDNGMAHYYLARALLELGDESGALEEAWRAVRDPASVSVALALAGEIYIRNQEHDKAIGVLQRAVANDAQDIVARNLLAVAFAMTGQNDAALEQVGQVIQIDPLDAFALAARHSLSGAGDFPDSEIGRRLRREPQTMLELVALFYRLKLYRLGGEMLRRISFAEGGEATPITCYYAAVIADLMGRSDWAERALDHAAELSPDYVFPDRLETIAVLQHAARLRPNDWRIPYYLGCLYMAKDRKDEAVDAWKKAVALGGNYSVLHRNLGIVAWKLDDDAKTAIPYYEKALALRPDDQTLSRDLATLYQKTNQWTKAREVLEKTLGAERYRSDVIELLARTYHHLGEDEKAAELIASRTFHAWEGQRSLYEIYRDVHVALGKKAFEAGDYKKAAAEFERSLEYPKNLGVGRPERVNEKEQREWLEKARKAAAKQ